MLLKSIKLFNFRQFKGEQEASFSTDIHKNVTVIMGDNGSGKTSFAQAFTWCLYGDTDFADKSMLNKEIENNLMPRQQVSVKVNLDLTHNDIEYNISRAQIYSRDDYGKIKPLSTSFNISYKKNGQQEFVKQSEVESRIKEILPKELSKYFFFDGERIQNFSKQIQRGKSKEFAQAVRGLLGLNAFIEAMEHLKPTSKFGVIGSYNDSYDSSSDDKIREYSNKIQKYQDDLDSIDQRLLQINDSIQIADEKCAELSNKINLHSEGERLQNEKKSLNQKIGKLIMARNQAEGSLLKVFNNNPTAYFAKSLIKQALDTLSNQDIRDKGIPDIHERTIKYLIDRGICVCGTKITFGNDAYVELNKALEYLPPKSIGTIISQFVNESEIRLKTSGFLYEQISDQYKIIRDFESDIDESRTDLSEIDKKLTDVVDVAPYQIDLHKYKDKIAELDREKRDLYQKRGAYLTSRDRLITDRSELTLRDEKNRKIEVYKAYAQYMYDELYALYQESEDKIRKKLENYINEIFRSIYEGGISLKIDSEYNIQILVEDTDGHVFDVEASTAQSLSVIFAFITGIIKIARENNNSIDDDSRMLESEPYPLVMDAPLSSFDKTRIRTICDTLPKIAEQIIIFIKDTDGEIAEEHLGQVVGKRYFFDKKNEFDTIIMQR